MDWQILQGNLTLQLDTQVCMNSKSRLIKSTKKPEIILNEVKRMVFIKKKKKKKKKRIRFEKWWKYGGVVQVFWSCNYGFQTNESKCKQFSNECDFLKLKVYNFIVYVSIYLQNENLYIYIYSSIYLYIIYT